MFRIITLTVAALTISIPVQAGGPSSPVTQALARAAVDRDALKTPAGRMALVITVKAYCDEVSSTYPRNSPKETEWLSSEVQAGGERMIRATRSAEWGREQVQIFVDGCASWGASFSRSLDQSRSYAGLAYTFIRFSGDAEYYAPKNRIDPDHFGFGVVPRMATEALILAAILSAK